MANSALEMDKMVTTLGPNLSTGDVWRWTSSIQHVFRSEDFGDYRDSQRAKSFSFCVKSDGGAKIRRILICSGSIQSIHTQSTPQNSEDHETEFLNGSRREIEGGVRQMETGDCKIINAK